MISDTKNTSNHLNQILIKSNFLLAYSLAFSTNKLALVVLWHTFQKFTFDFNGAFDAAEDLVSFDSLSNFFIKKTN